MKSLENTNGTLFTRGKKTAGNNMIKYTTKYTRKSGDPQTTTGNTLINSFAHYRAY